MKALVVGGSSGIGKDVVLDLAHKGWQVTLIARNRKRIEETIGELKTVSDVGHAGFAIDMSEPTSIDLLRQKITENLDALVVTSGSGRPVLSGSDSADFDASLRRNFLPIMHTWEAIGQRIVQGSGSAVFVSSIAGHQDIGAPIEYALTKSLVGKYAKLLARRYQNILVNAVSPGNVLTENSIWAERTKDREALEEYLKLNVPLQRLATSKELALVICDLATRRHSFITGHDLVVDGGQLK